jgi:uncharacterized membrane protein YedE/YeeE
MQENRPLLSWHAGGLLLAGVLLVTVATVKPIGVSTQYVRLMGAMCEAISPGIAETNAYFREEKVVFSYSEALVLFIPVGAFLVAWLTGRLGWRDVPEPWLSRFGSSRAARFAAAAAGGFLLLLGARLAGGCTSGHILSGVSQLAISSILFFIAAFGSAVATAKLLYDREEIRA